jgi:hypothetical protein
MIRETNFLNNFYFAYYLNRERTLYQTGVDIYIFLCELTLPHS